MEFARLLKAETDNTAPVKVFAVILSQIMRREKKATMHIYRVSHGYWKRIFDSPAAIIHNLLTQIRSGVVPAAIRSTTYKSRFEDVFEFMDVLILARAKTRFSHSHHADDVISSLASAA